MAIQFDVVSEIKYMGIAEMLMLGILAIYLAKDHDVAACDPGVKHFGPHACADCQEK